MTSVAGLGVASFAADAAAADCMAVGRSSGGGMRYQVLDRDGDAWRTRLADGGSGWGDSRGVSAIAMGDVDGDGVSELAVGRTAGGGMRYQVLRRTSSRKWTTILEGGSGWGDSRGVSALAMGDVDGDGGAELAVGRNAGGGMRYEVLRRRSNGAWTALLDDGGSGWGDSRGVSALAMGDVDRDGDAELALGRTKGGGMRYQVLRRNSNGSWFAQIDDGGGGWGESRGVTALAIGDLDGDDYGELAVGRNAGGGMRFTLDFPYLTWDDPAPTDGGSTWGSGRGVSALAIGDLNGNDVDELAVGRNAGSGMRYTVVSPYGGKWRTFSERIAESSAGWGDSRGVTALAMENVDGGFQDELLVGRNAGGGLRYRIAYPPFFEESGVGGSGWGDSRGVSAMAVSATRC